MKHKFWTKNCCIDGLFHAVLKQVTTNNQVLIHNLKRSIKKTYSLSCIIVQVSAEISTFQPVGKREFRPEWKYFFLTFSEN